MSKSTTTIASGFGPLDDELALIEDEFAGLPGTSEAAVMALVADQEHRIGAAETFAGLARRPLAVIR